MDGRGCPEGRKKPHSAVSGWDRGVPWVVFLSSLLPVFYFFFLVMMVKSEVEEYELATRSRSTRLHSGQDISEKG